MKTNFKFGEVLAPKSLIEATPDKVNFKNIFETENGGVSLLAIEKGQVLDEHIAPFEVMVNVLEGEIEFKMLDQLHEIKEGEFLLMGANVPHSVKAKADSKVMLIKIKN